MINKHKIKIIILAALCFTFKYYKYYFNDDAKDINNETMLEIELISNII